MKTTSSPLISINVQMDAGSTTLTETTLTATTSFNESTQSTPPTSLLTSFTIPTPTMTIISANSTIGATQSTLSAPFETMIIASSTIGATQSKFSTPFGQTLTSSTTFPTVELCSPLFSQICKNGGFCLVYTGNVIYCSCASGFFGTFCEKKF
jgi:hypothetical protein